MNGKYLIDFFDWENQRYRSGTKIQYQDNGISNIHYNNTVATFIGRNKFNNMCIVSFRGKYGNDIQRIIAYDIFVKNITAILHPVTHSNLEAYFSSSNINQYYHWIENEEDYFAPIPESFHNLIFIYIVAMLIATIFQDRYLIMLIFTAIFIKLKNNILKG